MWSLFVRTDLHQLAAIQILVAPNQVLFGMAYLGENVVREKEYLSAIASTGIKYRAKREWPASRDVFGRIDPVWRASGRLGSSVCVAAPGTMTCASSSPERGRKIGSAEIRSTLWMELGPSLCGR